VVLLTMAEPLALGRMDAAVATSLLPNLLPPQALQQVSAGLAELEAPMPTGALGGVTPQCSSQGQGGSSPWHQAWVDRWQGQPASCRPGQGAARPRDNYGL
jgi:hypothetical protein